MGFDIYDDLKRYSPLACDLRGNDHVCNTIPGPVPDSKKNAGVITGVCTFAGPRVTSYPALSSRIPGLPLLALTLHT